MNDNLRFIFTGGPGAGKTTTLDLLEKSGYACVPEVARQIIHDRKKCGLPPRPVAVEFARAVLAIDISQYDEQFIKDKPVFFDRGIGDALFMLHLCGELSIAQAIHYLTERPYHQRIFYFPPWEAIYATDGERDQTFNEAVRTAEQLAYWYKELGFSMIEVPLLPAPERAAFIWRTL